MPTRTGRRDPAGGHAESLSSSRGHQDARDKYRFRLRAETGETITTSRSHATRAEALARIKAVKRAAAKAHVPE